MADSVIVSTARTPIGRAYRGAFNNTHGAALAGHVISHAVTRARIVRETVDVEADQRQRAHDASDHEGEVEPVVRRGRARRPR